MFKCGTRVSLKLGNLEAILYKVELRNFPPEISFSLFVIYYSRLNSTAPVHYWDPDIR